jgi:transcriptional regulator with XRE-family HTH domain
MTYKSDPIRTLADLGKAVSRARESQGLTATAVARRAGRSRDILYRLERGEDVSASSLLDLLQAMGHQLALVPARLPTLDEARKRFQADDE